MKSIIYELSDISTKLQKAGADVSELDKFIDDIYDYEKTDKGYRCQLKDRGVCLHLMDEDADCYDNFDGCYLKKAGLYYCGEIGDVVDQEACGACNQNMDCGCCEYVQNGSASYNCHVCARIQIEIEGIGHYCVTPDTSPEEIERIKREAKENPGAFFSCL